MRRQTSPEEEALEELRRLKARAPSGKKKRTPWVRYTAVVLLAVVCIGGAELAACRFFAPALYEELMEPVRETAHQTAQTAGRALEAVCRAGNAAAKKAGEAAAVLALRAGEARAGFREWMEAVAAPPPEAEPLGAEDSTLAQPEIAPPREILDPLIRAIILREGQEILTGGGVDVVYFNQTDEARAGQKYGSDPLSTHGCGPTAMAMAVSSLTGEAVDPADMAALCVKPGHRGCGGGPDDQGALHQGRPLHPPPGRDPERGNPGGGPRQPGPEPDLLGFVPDFRRAVPQPPRRRTAVDAVQPNEIKASRTRLAFLFYYHQRKLYSQYRRYPFFSAFFTLAFTSGERTFPAARTGRGGRAQNFRTTWSKGSRDFRRWPAPQGKAGGPGGAGRRRGWRGGCSPAEG